MKRQLISYEKNNKNNNKFNLKFNANGNQTQYLFIN